MKKSLFAAASAITILATGSVSAQTMSNGPYYANPSWDQQLPSAQRFIILTNWNNAAVLDRETGLVWERTPIGTLTHWAFALETCVTASTGNRFGWRLPSIQELASLIDPSNGNTLPSGSPFLGVSSTPNAYWSSTTTGDIFAYVVAFGASGGGPGGHPVITADKTADGQLNWCVRSGSGLDAQ